MATAISVIMFGMLYGVYSSGVNIWEISSSQTDLQAQARNVLNFMSSELKNATMHHASANLIIPIPTDPTNTKHSIRFCLPVYTSGSVSIDANGETVWDTANFIDYQIIPAQKQLIKYVAGIEQRVIANDVSGVQFIDATIDTSLLLNELRIIITLNKTTPKQRNVSITLSTTVALRN